MTNQEVLAVAMRQSAIDAGCAFGDYNKEENVIVISKPSPRARKYLTLPFACDLVSYGTNVVASVDPSLYDTVRGFINSRSAERCFETPALHILDDALAPFGLRSCFMAEYWLPDVEKLAPLACPYETRLLSQPDFQNLYTPEWSNALCEKRRELDVLGVGAYDGKRLVGLAACSADCEDMWQIGVDVLPAYRRQGVASALTSALALAILERGKVPFYCCAWSNVKSARNAIRSGFRPGWVELTAKPTEFVDHMNGCRS